MATALYSKGYVHSLHDYSLFYKKSPSSIIFVVVHVDDVIITGTSSTEITELKTFLHDQFKIKDLGRLHYFLSLEVLYKEDGVIISQRKFALDLLKEFDCLHYTNLASPLDPNVKLKAKEGVDPREPHLQAALHLLRYLKGDPTLGIFMSNNPDCTIKGYCDSDWAACPDCRRSVSGYLVLQGTSPISWKSTKKETISLSSAEAEYRSLRKVVGELTWLCRLFEELTVPFSTPTFLSRSFWSFTMGAQA
ncbi:PREDICTED: uncharacterized protein LOC109221767 [Nicotiana attenuata]|uniref:uncharacterized protein LOC109221767 n=1 Tax=Nicotiana attenuata TaxID=49451 RepID=UPI00090593F2|nr:PREDICTED: uncharacterized protein LOC109221767 [Nicotiana attenuata]